MGIMIDRIAEDYANEAVADAKRDCGKDAETWEVEDAARQYLWERIDGCEHVIYTQTAWEIVASDPDYCEGAAEDMGIDVSTDYAERGLGAMMTALAFAGLYTAAMGFVYVEEDDAE